MNAEWLKYGELGLLALVLVGGGLGLKMVFGFLQRWFEAEVERKKATDAWMQKLIEADRQEREASTKRLDELVQSTIQAQQQVANGLADVTGSVNEHEVASKERHAETLKALGKGG